MGDNIALIRFSLGWEEDGTDPQTGMRRFKPVTKITKTRPPTTENTSTAYEEDFRNPDYAEAYQLFQNEQRGRTIEPEEGYPLVMWAAIAPDEAMQCFQHGIYTVEQLAKMVNSRSLPGSISEIAKRAAKMVELSAKKGKYETIISELEARVLALNEDNSQMKITLQYQNQQLDMLRMRLVQAA